MGFDTAVLEARVRSRCDMVGSGFVTSAEVQLWLEAAWQELYGFACSQNEDLFVKVVNLTAVAGTGDLVLPSDLKHLRGLRIQNEEFSHRSRSARFRTSIASAAGSARATTGSAASRAATPLLTCCRTAIARTPSPVTTSR
jgi:hypothetical protein